MSPSSEAPLRRLVLADGREATLLLRHDSTVLALGEVVSSWDLSGRPYALVRETGTYRRGLDGGLLWKREATAEGPRVRRRLSAGEGEPILEAARQEARAALAALTARHPEGGSPARHPEGGSPARHPEGGSPPAPEGSAGPADPSSPDASDAPRDDGGEAARRLDAIVSLDPAALHADARRFLGVCGPVGILPPDQYLSLVVRVTEGCSWNACTFCGLYRDVPFRWKGLDELAAHLGGLREFFGPGIALRRAVFLGDANALCLAHERLLPLVVRVATELPRAPLFSFVDAWTGTRRRVDEWREYARLGLRRVYVGLETGDPGLLAWLGKAGTPADAIELVGTLREAGVAAGVIVLLGAGGERFAEAHVERTAAALRAMELGPRDVVYFSEYVDDVSLEYGRRAFGAADLAPLTDEGCARQRRAIQDAVRPTDPAASPRFATYDVREFVY